MDRDHRHRRVRPIPEWGLFAETPTRVLQSLDPEYAQDDGLPPGFAAGAYSPKDCRLAMHRDNVVGWKYTAQWRAATPKSSPQGSISTSLDLGRPSRHAGRPWVGDAAVDQRRAATA